MRPIAAARLMSVALAVCVSAIASAATSCDGAVSQLAVRSDGTVTVHSNARNGVLRVCNVHRPTPTPWGVNPGVYARVVTADACRSWVDSLQSAVARGAAVTVRIAYDDATQTACTALPILTSPAPHPLPTAITLVN